MRIALWPAERAGHEPDMAEWLARPDATVLVAERAGGTGLAGFAEVGARSVVDGCSTSPVGYLEGWYVDEDVRRLAIGAALVRAAEAWARSRGYREFASDVELDNIISQLAHDALGFEETGRGVLYRKLL